MASRQPGSGHLGPSASFLADLFGLILMVALESQADGALFQSLLCHLGSRSVGDLDSLCGRQSFRGGTGDTPVSVLVRMSIEDLGKGCCVGMPPLPLCETYDEYLNYFLSLSFVLWM